MPRKFILIGSCIFFFFTLFLPFYPPNVSPYNEKPSINVEARTGYVVSRALNQYNGDSELNLNTASEFPEIFRDSNRNGRISRPLLYAIVHLIETPLSSTLLIALQAIKKPITNLSTVRHIRDGITLCVWLFLQFLMTIASLMIYESVLLRWKLETRHRNVCLLVLLSSQCYLPYLRELHTVVLGAFINLILLAWVDLLLLKETVAKPSRTQVLGLGLFAGFLMLGKPEITFVPLLLAAVAYRAGLLAAGLLVVGMAIPSIGWRVYCSLDGLIYSSLEWNQYAYGRWLIDSFWPLSFFEKITVLLKHLYWFFFCLNATTLGVGLFVAFGILLSREIPTEKKRLFLAAVASSLGYMLLFGVGRMSLRFYFPLTILLVPALVLGLSAALSKYRISQRILYFLPLLWICQYYWGLENG